MGLGRERVGGAGESEKGGGGCGAGRLVQGGGGLVDEGGTGASPMSESESLRIMCPNLSCRKILAIPPAARGKTVRCRACATNIKIPTSQPVSGGGGGGAAAPAKAA